ncbi:uncharacterized protein LOC123450999 [Hordeum vulgare subsp. vulgare]|uniref:Predicted protein n=1 Tax=Hordeum vulgare subsp. vulgare TaxID=112509 RepID=F2E8J1_HORVV|nr:uncharacterized protein LOC123450999 [Hordeum vulgare subsp. vulgare]BAK03663.1 predicted protein [Hordeum vulgare subsp. vulgare]
MAAGRRLSELLQEQQEPFLVEAAKIRRPRRGRGGGGGACWPVAACQRLLRLCNHGFKKRSAGIVGLRSALSKALCGKAVRSAFRWERLGGGCCFTGVGVGPDREFRRLRRSAGDSGECGARAMEFDDGYEREGAARWEKTDMEVDSSRQLSPVSVLELHSDVDSPEHPRWEEDERPSTSGSSPSAPSSDFHGPTSPCFTYDVRAMETTEEEDEETAGNHRGGKCVEEQISSWERIAGDITRIPAMVELDLSEHTRQWRGLGPEVRKIGARIETLIFEEIRRETVCDMLASHCTF